MPSSVASALLDTPVGDGIRLLTRRRLLRYPEEEPGYTPRAVVGSTEQKAIEKPDEHNVAHRPPSPNDLQPATSNPGADQAATSTASSRSSSCTLRPPERLNIVDWEGPCDPANPLNWPLGKKLWVSWCIGFATFAVYIGGSITTTSYSALMNEFGIVEQEAFATMSLYIFAYGAGALFFSPLSEMHQLGRNPPYYVPLLIAVGLQVGAATTPTFAGLVILRFLVGFLGAPLLATGGASIADVWGIKKLPVALCFIWVLPSFSAPGLAPIFTVNAVERFGWRWSMWIHLMFLSVGAVLILLCPETSADNLLHRRARRLRRLTGDETLRTRAEVLGAGKSSRALLYEALAIPFKVALLDPSILFCHVYIALCYAVFFSFFDVFPLVFGEIYHFPTDSQALIFLCDVAGSSLGALGYASYQLLYMFPLVRNKGMPVVERRLEPALVSSIMASVGLWIFAWSAYPQAHWMGPTVGATLFVVSNIVTFQCVFYYLILSYPKYAASVLAGSDFARSSLAAGVVHGATPLFRSSAGIHGGVSLLAGLAACGIVGIWTLYLCGAKLRARSRFTGGEGEEESGLGHVAEEAIEVNEQARGEAQA
ncbi:hypothetical protein JCM9279_004003 [Rhodotorula babjevae]